MPTTYTTSLGLALPASGELAGTWGDIVNAYITNYLDAAIAGAQTISGSQTAVTLSTTTGASLVQAGVTAAGSAQYSVINCTGNPASLLTITVPAANKTYLVINATSTSQSVKIVGAGPTAGVTIISGERAIVAWNGSDFVKIAANSVTGLTQSQLLYGSATGTIAQSSSLVFDGTALGVGTASPVGKITLAGLTATSTDAEIQITRTSSNTGIGQGPGIRFNDGTTNNTRIIQNGSANLQFWRYSGSWVTDMTLSSSGNLGLGSGVLSTWSGFGNPVFEVLGGFVGSAGTNNLTIAQNVYHNGGWKYKTTGLASYYDLNGGTHRWYLAPTGTAGTAATLTQGMILNSDGVLNVSSVSAVAWAPSTLTSGPCLSRSSSDSYVTTYLDDTSITIGSGTSWKTGIAIYGQSHASGNYIAFRTGNAERARIDTSGNLGVGNTPQAWSSSSYKAVQIGGGSAYVAGRNDGFTNHEISLGHNAYFNGTNWIYVATSLATAKYYQFSGTHVWQTAAAGTAGTAITFTDAMKLDANGVLNVSSAAVTWAPSTLSAGPCLSRSSLDSYVTTYLDDSSITIGAGTTWKTGIAIYAQSHVNGNYIAFRTGNAERARIDTSGNLGIGNSSPVNKLDVNGSFGRGAPVTKTADFTLAANENWIICNKSGANMVVTLPAASSWTGREIMFKNVVNGFSVVSASSNVVPPAGGAAGTAICSVAPASQAAYTTLVSDGTNWITMLRVN